MNEVFEKFREVQEAQERAVEKSKLLAGVGRGIEEAIKGKLDAMELRHPEILDKMLELHLLLMYETNPQLEPLKDQGQAPSP